MPSIIFSENEDKILSFDEKPQILSIDRLMSSVSMVAPFENHTPTAECAPPVSMFIVYNSMPLSVKSEVWNYGFRPHASHAGCLTPSG